MSKKLPLRGGFKKVVTKKVATEAALPLPRTLSGEPRGIPHKFLWNAGDERCLAVDTAASYTASSD